MQKEDSNFRQLSRANGRRHFPRIGGGILAALALVGAAAAQNPSAENPFPAPATAVTAPDGYVIHQSVDAGGHITHRTGSEAMYDTLVNVGSGPRVLGQTFELHALPGAKSTLVDNLSAFSSGYGGEENNVARLDFSKKRRYEFAGLFRRDRQYFDYGLLGNPSIPTGFSIPIGPATAPVSHFAWPQVDQSPVMFNTVRRMTDTHLNIFPQAKLSFRAGYSQNVFAGPSLSPAASSNDFAQSIGATDQLLEQYQRNSTDDFLGAVDWKPARETRLSYEEQVTHYKGDSYFTLSPQSLFFQEADGTRVAIGNWDSLTPYGASNCNANSLGAAPMLSPPPGAGGLPIINAACAVAASYLRSQPTRVLFPTEIFRFQSSGIKTVSMNGEARYTQSNMNLPRYYENFEGLDGTVRTTTFSGFGSAKREAIGADYGLVWQASPAVTVAEQVDFSNVHQPGTDYASLGSTLNTPATAGNETINYPGPLAPASGAIILGGPNGAPQPDYFGLKSLTDKLTLSWIATPRVSLALGYLYRTRTIAEGIPHNTALPVGATSGGTVSIDQNGGTFHAALRPGANWTVNGSAELLYADNALTPLGARQSQRYQLRTRFRPRPWATISGAYTDLERRNNTDNNQSGVAAGDATYAGPLAHVDHSRFASLGASLLPSERYGFDFTYAYSDVYTSTNICYDAAASKTIPGAATPSGAACPGGTVLFAPYYEFGPVKDFMDAPTQYGSAALTLAAAKKLHAGLGYRVSSVAGSQFFNDPRAVNGSLESTFQSPFANLAFAVHPGWVWRAEYNFFGYGEGGASGAQTCSLSNPTPSAPAPVVPCASLPFPTGQNEPHAGLTAPRNFHANNVTMGMHYEF